MLCISPFLSDLYSFDIKGLSSSYFIQTKKASKIQLKAFLLLLIKNLYDLGQPVYIEQNSQVSVVSGSMVTLRGSCESMGSIIFYLFGPFQITL